MKQVRQIGILLLIGLLFALALAACGGGASDTHFRQGNDYSENGQFDKAVEEYQLALETEPDNASVLTNLGVAYYNLGNLDGAIEAYTKAIEFAPSDADIRSNLGAAYVQQYQAKGADPEYLDKAVAAYEKAAELDPSLAEARFGLGVIYLLLGQNEDALLAFEKFLELDEGRDSMATSLAQQYLTELRGE